MAPPCTEDPELRKVAEQFAGFLKRELPFDFTPFTAHSSADGEEVLLVKSRKVLLLSPVACGAIGLDRRSMDRDPHLPAHAEFSPEQEHRSIPLGLTESFALTSARTAIALGVATE